MKELKVATRILSIIATVTLLIFAILAFINFLEIYNLKFILSIIAITVSSAALALNLYCIIFTYINNKK